MRLIATLFALLFATAAQAQIVNTLPFQLQNGTTADATQVMADFNQIVSNVNANGAKNGANSDITSLSGLTTPLSPNQGGSSVYTGGTSSGSANAQSVSTAPLGFTLVAGKRAVFVAGFTNTGATTLAINSTVATNVFYPTPSGPLALTGGEIVAGNIVEVWFDGTQYQLITNNLAVVGTLTSATAATTTDLGAVATHNVNITGATTITAFGSSASTAFPIYYLTFASTPTLTYNASSMILPGAADITAAAGDTAVAQYLGSGNWKVWSYQRASGGPVVASGALCGASGLRITNNSGTPNTSIDVTWASAVTTNSNNISIINTTPTTVTINSTSSGAVNQWDATRPTSNWGYVFLISNGNTWGALGSGSATAPTMPSGYTYKCRVGAMQFDGSQNLARTLQQGNTFVYNVPPIPTIVSGVLGVATTDPATWVAATVAGATAACPTTAVSALIQPYFNANTMLAAPNANYGGNTSTAKPPLINITGSAGSNAPVEFYLEATTVQYASNGVSNALFGYGCRDSVNAN